MRTFVSRVATAALLALAISPVAAQDALQSWIVVLRPGTANVPEVAADVARAYGGQRGFVYQHALKGFSIKASPQLHNNCSPAKRQVTRTSDNRRAPAPS